MQFSIGYFSYTVFGAGAILWTQKGVVFMLGSVTERHPSMCIVLGIMTYSDKLLEKWVP